MKKRLVYLINIENNEQISAKDHYDFLYHLQLALLLALQERGMLNPMQYRYAEKNLKKQRIARANYMLKKGKGND